MNFKSLELHKQQINNLASQLKNSKDLISLKKNSTCCVRAFDYKKDTIYLDINCLNNILEINAKEKYVHIEPGITIEELVKATLPFGLVPPVITEFKQMSYGGSVLGLGGESSSFKYGTTDNAVLEYHVLLANGEQIVARPDINQDLYYALPGSFGSLCILTSLKVQLIEAKKYVRVDYHHVSSMEQVLKAFETAQTRGLDFIEAIAFSQDQYLIGEGRLVSRISFWNRLTKFLSLHKSWDPWYFPHLKECFLNKNGYEFMSYSDYVFRWDKGAFWLGLYNKERSGFIPHTFRNRFLIGNRLKCSNLYKKMYSKKDIFKIEQQRFAHDLIVPIENAKEFVNYLDNKLSIHPLWLIPLKPPKQKTIFAIPTISKLYVDIGVWGWPKNLSAENFIEFNRNVEHKLKEIGGIKWMWNQAYYTEEEFWSIYDRNKYLNMRNKYHASERLVNIYKKVSELILRFNKELQ